MSSAAEDEITTLREHNTALESRVAELSTALDRLLKEGERVGRLNTDLHRDKTALEAKLATQAQGAKEALLLKALN